MSNLDTRAKPAREKSRQQPTVDTPQRRSMELGPRENILQSQTIMGSIAVNAHMVAWEPGHAQKTEEMFQAMRLALKATKIDVRIAKKTHNVLTNEIVQDWKEEKEERMAQQASESRETAKLQEELRERCAVRKLAGSASNQTARLTKSRKTETCKGPAEVIIPPPSQAPTKQSETKFAITMNKAWSEMMEEEDLERSTTPSQSYDSDDSNFPRPPSPKVKSTVTIPPQYQEQQRQSASYRNKNRYESKEPSRHPRQPKSFKVDQRVKQREDKKDNKSKKCSHQGDGNKNNNGVGKSRPKKREREPSVQVTRKAHKAPPAKRSPVKIGKPAKEEKKAIGEMSEKPTAAPTNEYSPMDLSTFMKDKDKKKAKAQLGSITDAELNLYKPFRRAESESSGYTHSEPEPMDAQQIGESTDDEEDDYEEMGFG
ncbi:unnamed protein product [Caenorhabditis nigoni]